MKRKTYSVRAAIPADLLAALNAGSEEPRTLAEWLAVDAARLLAAILPAAGLGDHAEALVAVARQAAEKGVMTRQRAIAAALFRVVGNGGVYEHRPPSRLKGGAARTASRAAANRTHPLPREGGWGKGSPVSTSPRIVPASSANGRR